MGLDYLIRNLPQQNVQRHNNGIKPYFPKGFFRYLRTKHLTMKTTLKLFLIALLLSPVLAIAQQKSTPPKATPQSATSDCFKEWYSLFQERGAKPVTDGTHDVVLTLRNTTEGTSKCYMGRVDVVDGKLKRPIWVQKEDGTFDTFSHMSGKRLEPAFEKSMVEDDLMAITDGMSINMKTSDMEFGRIFFYNFLNDKPKSLKQAPSPKALIKN